MRLLFTMDRKDYGECTRTFTRNSARSIIIRGGRIAMIHSAKYDYYKFPGGGVEAGETPAEAMARETLEEAGLTVIPDSVREYGCVHRIQRSERDPAECFIQDNYYFLCRAEETVAPQKLDGYEAEEGCALEFVDPKDAIRKNRGVTDSPYSSMMLERETRVLELLTAEGYFTTGGCKA